MFAIQIKDKRMIFHSKPRNETNDVLKWANDRFWRFCFSAKLLAKLFALMKVTFFGYWKCSQNEWLGQKNEFNLCTDINICLAEIVMF